MASRRAKVLQYYSRPRGTALTGPALFIEKSAAHWDQYNFKGAELKFSAVTRMDLNGYSAWARDRPVADRVALLDDFFSSVVPLLEQHGGVYFRDEGDCIVSIFSEYFATGWSFEKVRSFCQAVTSKTYGSAGLTAKTTIALGDVAFFQKAHEVGTEDWSAEGEPFVRCARLEQAVESKQRIYWYAFEYDIAFAKSAVHATSGSLYYWTYKKEPLQVPGLGLSGGWTDVSSLEYVPGGARQG